MDWFTGKVRNFLSAEDKRLPIANAVQDAVYTCLICKHPHNRLPNFNDFKIPPYSHSTRISEISVFEERLWKVTNYRKEEYYRHLGSTPLWYYRNRGKFTLTCEPAGQHLEVIYGRIITQAHSPKNEWMWMFKGYAQKRTPQDWKIWFSEREYNVKTQGEPQPDIKPLPFGQQNYQEHHETSVSRRQPTRYLGISTIPPRTAENQFSAPYPGGAKRLPGKPQVELQPDIKPLPADPKNHQQHGGASGFRKQPSSSKVFSELRTKFLVKNRTRSNWMKMFPLQLKFDEYPIYALFDLSIKHSDGRNSEKLLWPVETSNRWILVQSPPGFGKTTLLSILALQWSLGFSEVTNFELCIMLNLAKPTFNLKEPRDFITACNEEVEKPEYTSDMVEKALTKNSEKILLLLDGYDMLPEESQHSVLNFLQTSTAVSKSTVLIATRPPKNSNFVSLFGKHVSILGFSRDYLQKYGLKGNIIRPSINTFCNFFEDESLCFLFELSPYFTSFVYSIAVNPESYRCNTNKSLDFLVRVIIVLVIKLVKKSVRPKKNVWTLLRDLGKLLFRGLALDKRIFTTEALQKIFSMEDLAFLVKCNIFYRQDRDSTLWLVSSKLLAVFFSTMYFNTEWSELKDEKQRKCFLRNEFCFGVCDGDYVQGEGCLYYIGLIPEIVLIFTDSCSLGSATFEMYCDVEPIEKTSAFDSVNLLSRVGDTFLGRFGFRINPDDEELLLTTFGCIFNFMSVENCNVGYSFYTNVYEKKQFMMIDVKTREDSVVLRAILRAKTEKLTDRICIDFSYRNFDDLFEFFRALLSQYLKDFQLPEELKAVSPMTFIFNLVFLLCTSIDKGVATITCGWAENDFFRTYASFKVCRINDSDENIVHVLAYDQKFKCTRYTVEDFITSSWSNPQDIVDGIERNFRISINLF